MNKIRKSKTKTGARPHLKLDIRSFSYKQGLPEDRSGHGGGFIFDCRALPNPGREEQFKKQSGKSGAVIKFLERLPESKEFFTLCKGLVAQAVKAYKARGFESLSVSFGCTGGQHRSVFMAEKLARMFRGRSGIRTLLTHRDLEASLKRARAAR